MGNIGPVKSKPVLRFPAGFDQGGTGGLHHALVGLAGEEVGEEGHEQEERQRAQRGPPRPGGGRRRACARGRRRGGGC